MAVSLARIIRALRTPSSERYLLQAEEGKDCGALEIHYLPDGSVSGTLLLLEGSGIAEEEVPELLRHLDEVLLPSVSFDENNLSFTVVEGRVVGEFVHEQTES